MSRFGQITTDWGDAEYTFRLGLGELEELEAKFDKSIFVLVNLFRTRTAKSTEILETLRIGLIGGGMSAPNALALKRRYGDERPLEESRDVAYAVAMAALARVHGDELKPEKRKAPRNRKGSTSR